MNPQIVLDVGGMARTGTVGTGAREPWDILGSEGPCLASSLAYSKGHSGIIE
jgi:hypothetical protein